MREGLKRDFVLVLPDPVTSVAVSPDGKRIVAGSGVDTLTAWNAETGALEAIKEGMPALVTSLAYAPDSAHILAGNYNGIVRVCSADTFECVREIKAATANAWALAVSSDGKKIVAGWGENMVHVVNFETGQCEHVLDGDDCVVSPTWPCRATGPPLCRVRSTA